MSRTWKIINTGTFQFTINDLDTMSRDYFRFYTHSASDEIANPSLYYYDSLHQRHDVPMKISKSGQYDDRPYYHYMVTSLKNGINLDEKVAKSGTYADTLYVGADIVGGSHTITKTLNNCTSDIPDTIDDGTQFTWTLTPIEGYEFKDGSVTSNVGTVSITSTGATITGTATTDIMIQATATQKETPKETVNITAGTIQNCSYVPTTANHGDTVTITITSDTDYAFTTQAPYIEYVGPLSQLETHKFTLNSDKTIGTISLDTNDIKKRNDTYTVTVTGNATYQQGTTVSEMYTVYSVSPSDLQAVSNKRFVNVSGSDAYNEQLITYINDLYRLPLTFKDLPTQALMLKNETIVNNAHVIPNVTYTYDMGTVTLPKKYSNSNDYNNVYDVMLPYYGVYTLDNAKALDTPIKIQAVIDIISGSCTYIFSRDGHAIDSVKTNIKENLPYMTRDMQQTGSLSTVTQFEVEPSITCYYHDITNAYVNKDVNDTVSNLTYFKADNIIHCNGISNKYKNLILNKLREGVFTNEL